MTLVPERLLAAYRNGIFPMAIDAQGTIGWFSPDPRAVIPLDDRFHVPHGLRRAWKACRVIQDPSAGSVRSSGTGVSPVQVALSPDRTGETPVPLPAKTNHGFEIRFDREFEPVMRACAKRREGTWISEEIIAAYVALHRQGHAHSVETWQAGQLVGGLYGVHIGAAFFGESMFHRATDASKVALVALVERLRAHGFVLLDTQWLTPHLAQFGTFELPRNEYLRMLTAAVARDGRWE